MIAIKALEYFFLVNTIRLNNLRESPKGRIFWDISMGAESSTSSERKHAELVVQVRSVLAAAGSGHADRSSEGDLGTCVVDITSRATCLKSVADKD